MAAHRRETLPVTTIGSAEWFAELRSEHERLRIFCGEARWRAQAMRRQAAAMRIEARSLRARRALGPKDRLR